MVDDPRRDVWLRLGRAAEHRETLQSEMLTFFSHQPDRVASKLDNKRTNGDITERVPVLLEPLPTHWSLLISDCLQNLRMSLDTLAWSLAKRQRPNPDRRTAFPICKTPADWDGTDKRRGAKHVARHAGADAQEIIRNCQPYIRVPDNVDSDPLWILTELARLDRHQTLTTSVVVHEGAGLVFDEPLQRQGNVVTDEGHSDPFIFATAPVMDDTEVTVRFAPASPDIHSYSHVVFGVGFDTDGRVGHGLYVVDLLTEIERGLREIILPAFADCFRGHRSPPASA